ncbi:MAG: response regulator [Planctomycetes bacterium]|nr:response regulator [Planctomycetota bacterium]
MGTGAAARKVLDEDGCDLLITDKNLPDASGLELLRLVKQRSPLSEVIVITGYASLETAVEALEFDAFDYVLKPLNNVFDIRKKVRQALQKQDLALENLSLIRRLTEQNASSGEGARGDAEPAAGADPVGEAGRSDLAAGVAHEISSPLFGIMGLAEAVIEEPDRELTVQYATDIVEYCRNIRDIVQELSSYSRTASKEFLTAVDVPRAIEDALRLVERSTSVQGVNFRSTFEERASGLVVHARGNEIQQVFVNLIRNASEAVQERWGREGAGRVEISAGPGEGHVWARVRDNGVGIPEEKIGAIFDPFYTTKAPGKGTGLGLNVVFRILTKYRGHIQVESRVGEGTTFTLKIPVEA